MIWFSIARISSTRVLLSIIAAASVLAPHLTAQPPFHSHAHPELWTGLQDSLDVYLVPGGMDTIPASWVSASYSFDMLYDSTMMTTYDIAEFKRNGERIRLAKWWSRRRVNAPANLLSFNSRTDTFTCHTGDTLSFYRELSWRNLMTGIQDTAIYYALDSLDYSVELVRTSDSTRLILLDSIGIMANMLPGSPRLHGMRPLMALVHYVVPALLEGTNSFMRVRLFHRGSGPYWFTRNDQVTIALSRRLNDSNWQDFLSVFTPGFPKYPIRDTMHSTDRAAEGATLSVRADSKSSREVSIHFDAIPNAPTTVVIYDGMGKAVYFPYMTSTSPGGLVQAQYRFEQPGVYLIALFHSGKLVNSHKIIITE